MNEIKNVGLKDENKIEIPLRVIIGKKIIYSDDKILLKIEKEQFETRFTRSLIGM